MTAVSDANGNTSYTVTFNQRVQNCVVQAVPGEGDPQGESDGITLSTPIVDMLDEGAANQVTVISFSPASATVTDTSFMITAFC